MWDSDSWSKPKYSTITSSIWVYISVEIEEAKYTEWFGIPYNYPTVNSKPAISKLSVQLNHLVPKFL